jgi:phosphoglycerate dehydrogenase-like enzyme
MSPILTRCPIFSEIVALHAFTLALATLRRIPDAVKAQMKGLWERPFEMLSTPQTAMILGMGYIGRAIAAILKKHDIKVIGVDKKPSQEKETACDEFLDSANWRDHLQHIDLFFIALPLTKETSGLLDATTLAEFPGHAVIIDVSRGGIVDIDALARQLNDGHLGGAALDVIDPIPESPADPIWKTPNLLITPKVSVFYPERQNKLEEYIESQVKRYIEGEELLHKVDIDSLVD